MGLNVNRSHLFLRYIRQPVQLVESSLLVVFSPGGNVQGTVPLLGVENGGEVLDVEGLNDQVLIINTAYSNF